MAEEYQAEQLYIGQFSTEDDDLAVQSEDNDTVDHPEGDNITDQAEDNNIVNQPEDKADDPLQVGLLIAKAQTYFADRTLPHDIDTLAFSLQHIFYCVDQLYMSLLPDLSSLASWTIQPDKQNSTPYNQEHAQYCIWTILQEIEGIFERLEPLCHLLITATSSILNQLNRTCSIQNITDLLHIDTSIEVAYSEKQDCTYIVSPDQDQWQHIYPHIQKQLQKWRHHNKERVPFCQHFAMHISVIPAITQIDLALDTINENCLAIFGEILPDFQALSTGDDGSAATLMLDLVQKADQLLIYLASILEPFHILYRQYAQESILP